MRELIGVALRAAGFHRTPPVRLTTAAQVMAAGLRRAHYGSGGRLLSGWVNIDLGEIEAPNYLKADLIEPHPFPDAWFEYGFAEDFLEHLDQEQSLRFLIEAHRTLQPGGVLRLCFPGLEGVLVKHYSPPTHSTAVLAAKEAYNMWGHRHFYSVEELRTAASHIGFSELLPVPLGVSRHAALTQLESRLDQAGLNSCVELVK